MLFTALAAGTTQAVEVQLAGIRLGQHAINLLDVYGEPEGIQTAAGAEFAGGGGAAAAAGMEGGEGMPGEEPAMMGGEMAGGPAEAPGAGEFPAPEGEMAAGPAAGAAAAGGAAGETVQHAPYPRWVDPVWVPVEGYEVEWFYRIGGVVLGFVLDRDGYIKTIAIAAERCDFARTALWEPHGYVKLGDDYKRVIYRYGWPDTMVLGFSGYGFSGGSFGSGIGVLVDPSGNLQGVPNAVAWGAIGRIPATDFIMQYDRNNNIAFTLHDMKVVRIHIWTHE